jgi:TonB family protein
MNIQLRHPICHLCEALLCTLILATLGRARAQAGLTYQDGVTTPPVLTHFVQAEYTQKARRASFQGFCIVHLTVDERGIPQDVHVARHIGMGLDGSAIKAVQQERFKPAMRGGRPVAFTFPMKVNFKPTPRPEGPRPSWVSDE